MVEKRRLQLALLGKNLEKRNQHFKTIVSVVLGLPRISQSLFIQMLMRFGLRNSGGSIF